MAYLPSLWRVFFFISHWNISGATRVLFVPAAAGSLVWWLSLAQRCSRRALGWVLSLRLSVQAGCHGSRCWACPSPLLHCISLCWEAWTWGSFWASACGYVENKAVVTRCCSCSPAGSALARLPRGSEGAAAGPGPCSPSGLRCLGRCAWGLSHWTSSGFPQTFLVADQGPHEQCPGVTLWCLYPRSAVCARC